MKMDRNAMFPTTRGMTDDEVQLRQAASRRVTVAPQQGLTPMNQLPIVNPPGGEGAVLTCTQVA
jgi:hypothetical protein